MNDEPKGLISRESEETMEYEFQKQKEQEIIKMWLEDHDLIIASEPINIDMNKCTWDLEYRITNIPDPGAGIFQYQYSPVFKNKAEAYQWCKAIMELCGKWKEYEKFI